MFKHWLVGLANAAISGLVTSATSAGIFHGSWKQNLGAAGIAAGFSAGKWFLQHPLPGADYGK